MPKTEIESKAHELLIAIQSRLTELGEPKDIDPKYIEWDILAQLEDILFTVLDNGY